MEHVEPCFAYTIRSSKEGKVEIIFDGYTVLSLMALGLALFIAVLLMYHGRADSKNFVLGTVAVLFAFNLYHDLMVHSQALVNSPLVWGLGGAFNPTIAVLCYLYLLSWCHDGWKPSYFFHLILPTVYLAYRIASKIYVGGDLNMLIHYFEERPTSEPEINWAWTIGFLFSMILPACYLVWSIPLLAKEVDSYLNRWRKFIFAFPLIQFLFICLWYLKTHVGLPYDQWHMAILFTVVQIGLFGLLIIRFPIQTSQGLIKGLKYSSSKLSVDAAKTYVDKIEHVIGEQQLYMQPEFSLKDLAQVMGINQSYLSQCFNEQLNTSFTDYINRYRVALASKHLLNSAYDKYTVESIASEVGFNSKSSYYRAFKKHTGQTPAEYKRLHAKM